MPRPIRSIDIYLPLEYNDGQPVEETKFVALEDELLDRFGGVTTTQRRFPLKGLWQRKSRVYQDNVVIFTAMDFHATTASATYRALESLKSRLMKRFS
jgi:hypothetical protein